MWNVEATDSNKNWQYSHQVTRYTDARFGDTISIERVDNSSVSNITLRMSREHATRLAKAILAAVEWEDNSDE